MALIKVEGALLCHRIRGPEDVGDELVDLLGRMPQEVVVAISLDPAQRVLGLDVVALGSSWRACAEPSDVFAGVLRRGAAGVVVAHNHPSGTCAPTSSDLAFTARLLEVDGLIGIELVDHLIVTKTSWRSLRESTHLWNT